jgi:ATP-binding protein involved in chromosome partitioning
MNINEQQIYEALKTVEDPDLKRDLVTLNMIKNVEVSDGRAAFTVELTTPACPLKDEIEQNCKQAIQNHVSADLQVDIEMTSNVTSKRESKDLLPGVKNIIAVASGKGGVGKSTVSANLATGLAQDGAKVGLIDADIYGPSVPTMFGLQNQRPEVEKHDDKHYILPLEKHGVKLLSIGFLVDDTQAVVWRGPMVSSAVKQFVSDCIWGELDYLILDLPPGTGDIHLTVVQTMPVTGAVIVTTPQEVALSDARKAVGMFQMDQVKVPVVGVVENMSYFVPAEFPDYKYNIFGEGGGQKVADEYQIPLLAQIPLVQSIRESGDEGVPAVIGGHQLTKEAFANLSINTAQSIAIRNANLDSTEKVEITYQ